MTGPSQPPAVRLHTEFAEAKKSARFGAPEILQRLSDLASACIETTTNGQGAVAFALSELFRLHAEDREDRPLTTDDTYHLLASGEEYFSEAIEFVANGGSADDAVRIVVSLARLIPDRLYGRSV